MDNIYNTSTGQLVQISAGGASDASFGYYSVSDNTGSANGRLQTASRGSTTVTLKYDGPLTTSQAWSGTAADAVNGSATWAYDADFRVKSETVLPAPTPAGLGTVSYLYDADGLPTCASLSASLTTCTASASTMTLVPSPTTGALTSTSLGVVTETYARNEYGEPASYTAKVGALPFSIIYDDGSATQSRDGFGRIYHQVETTAFGTTTTDYRYDEQPASRRFRSMARVSRQYRYDYNGNRTSVDGGATTIGTYDAQDRMSAYNGALYGYGPNGERRRRTNTDGSVDEYQYDALGNLSHITRADGVTIDYVVDALNRRIVKKKNGAIYARYIYRNGLSPVAVLDGSGALAARFVYVTRPNTPDFMVLANGAVFKFLNDERGTPRAIANSTGNVAQFVTYDEFGNPTTVFNNNSFPAWVQPFGFAGGLYDEDTGLVRFGARDYEAATGRWLAKDPALFGGGQANLYVYAGNDPVNRTDPTGLVDGFLWRSYSKGMPDLGGAAVEGEALGIVGYDSSSGAYGTIAVGVGPRIGDETNNLEAISAHEVSTPLFHSGTVTTNGILLLGGNAGPDGFLAGAGIAYGVYRQSTGIWGWYLGAGPDFLGLHSAAGFGFAFPSSWQAAIERVWSGAAFKKVCP